MNEQREVHVEPNGAGAVDIPRVGGPPIRIVLPARVTASVQWELTQANERRNLAAELARNYQAWEDGTSTWAETCGRDICTCFDDCLGDPSLLFWTLEHFSDGDFPLAGERKFDLTFHTFEEARDVRHFYVTELMSTETAESFDYCWYFLVRLLAMHAAAVDQQHRAVMRCHFSLLLQDVWHYHAEGWISIASPQEDLEQRLIDLAIRHPDLKAHVTQIISDWNQMPGLATSMEQIAKVRSDSIRAMFRVSRDEPDADLRRKDDITRRSRRQSRVRRKIRCLERLMTPATDDDAAWHHPLAYIERLAEGRDVLVLKPSARIVWSKGPSHGQRFELRLMEQLSRQGFRRWLHSQPDSHLGSIQAWLKDRKDSRSLKSLVETVQEYMRWQSGSRRQPCQMRPAPSLRDLFGFPRVPEPAAVTQEIQYWQELRDAQERAAAEVRLYLGQIANVQAAALEWIRACDGKEFIVIEGAAFSSSDYARSTAQEKSLIILHGCDPSNPAFYAAILKGVSRFWPVVRGDTAG